MKRQLSLGAVLVVLLPVLLVLGDVGPASSATPAVCTHPARRGFVPTRAAVIGNRPAVLAMGRLAGGLPAPPPLTNSGKQAFAWDRYGPKPGATRGNVRFNAHTYPDGSALGNRLLRRLRAGQRIILYGNGAALCYRVTRMVITTPRRLGGYYNTLGRPQLVIVVCSGRRLGPGDWTNRTIWYASPTTS